MALETQVDRELQGSSWKKIAENADELTAQRNRNAQGVLEEILGTPTAEERAVAWKHFQRRHPDYDADYWAECRALYAGGKRLLRDPDIMARLFPSHNAEDPAVYEERKRRAFYLAYPGTIIDNLVSGLGADPLRVTGQDAGEDETKLPAWYTDQEDGFLEDVSPSGGKRQGLFQLLLEAVREAMITRRAWILIDLPSAPPAEEAPASRLDQERAGLLDPYLIGVEPEYVIDWQTDSNGELEWALICDSETRRENLTSARDTIRKTFTWYDREGWASWQIEYKAKDPPKPDQPVPFLAEGSHPFGKVPLIPFELPEGLHAMGKLESLAREHFNKRAAVSWAEFKSLFAMLYEFLAPEDGISGQASAAQEEADRAVNQIRGPGHVQERGHEDRAEFVGPPVDPFVAGRESCQEIMREMFRVMYSMALSVDMGSSAIKRSGESKAQDKAVAGVILKELGRLVRDLAQLLMSLVAIARGDGQAFRVSGAAHFDSVDVAAAIKEGVELLNGIPIKSATFKRAYLYRLYKLVLGGEITEEELAKIREELESMISAEEALLEDSMALEDRGDQEEDQEEEEGEDGEDGGASAEEDARRRARNGRPVRYPAR